LTQNFKRLTQKFNDKLLGIVNIALFTESCGEARPAKAHSLHARKHKQNNKTTQTMKTKKNRFIAITAASVALALPAFAASGYWNTTTTDANWATDSNWDTAAAPGDLLATNTNADTATFNATVTNGFGTTSPVVIDAGRNLKSISFSTAAASAYVIGTTGGNAILLSSGGTILTDKLLRRE
jgi:hypothetical protein